MSIDSLNATKSKNVEHVNTPMDEKTYTIAGDDKESNLERISQVSPCILSPTTESSVPENLNSENVTGVSTLSKTTVPTDAKFPKPSENQCLSKATSMDSWCSNDTLFNVEDNFDDLAMDQDVPLDCEHDKEDNSNSTGTLHGHDEQKEDSLCSTYIIHDNKSDACDSFTPDSITANDNNMKAKSDNMSPSVCTKSELNDSSEKKTQTKDLAYETLISGCNSHAASFSNCTMELLSTPDDIWKLYQPPEMVRRSPNAELIILSPPQLGVDDKNEENIEEPVKIPNLQNVLTRQESIDISSISHGDDITQIFDNKDQSIHLYDSKFNPDIYDKSMPQSSSTPFNNLKQDDNTGEVVVFDLSHDHNVIENDSLMSAFESFLYSAENKPQNTFSLECNDEIPTTNTDLLLLAESENTTNAEANLSSITYNSFENMALNKPQQVGPIQNLLGTLSPEFINFENSIRSRPQNSTSNQKESFLVNNENQLKELFEDTAKTNVNVPHHATPPNIEIYTTNSNCEDTNDITASINTSNTNKYLNPNESSTSNIETTSKQTDLKDKHSFSKQISNLLIQNEIQCNEHIENSKLNTSLVFSFLPNITKETIIAHNNDKQVSCNENNTYSDILNEHINNIETFSDVSSTNINSSNETSPHTDVKINNHEIYLKNNQCNNKTPYLNEEEELHDDKSSEQLKNVSLNQTFNSHLGNTTEQLNKTYDSHSGRNEITESDNNSGLQVNDLSNSNNSPKTPINFRNETSLIIEHSNDINTETEEQTVNILSNNTPTHTIKEETSNNSNIEEFDSKKYATVNVISDTFEELLESNVDGTTEDINDPNDIIIEQSTSPNKTDNIQNEQNHENEIETQENEKLIEEQEMIPIETGNVLSEIKSQSPKLSELTNNFLTNEKQFCQFDAYLPLLSDIRFTGKIICV